MNLGMLIGLNMAIIGANLALWSWLFTMPKPVGWFWVFPILGVMMMLALTGLSVLLAGLVWHDWGVGK